jgi:choline dehydrogenase
VNTRAHDVIVVGSGSAGAVVARRLVDRDLRVLLLEAGAADSSEAIHDPARVHELWGAPEDWAYQTVPQEHAAGRRLAWPRGRVLGGSSCLNGMIWVRGAPADYDHWAHGGNPGWTWDDVRPWFERMESGPQAPLLTEYEPDAIHRSIGEAAQEIGIALNPDYNGPEQDGFSFVQLTIREGRRCSTAAAYLSPILDHPGLTLALESPARRLLFEGDRCIGVEFEGDGGMQRAHADGGVVVAGGVIGSPGLLLASGIGPADELRALGLDVVADLPGVGRNLHDHLLSPVLFAAEREIGPPSPGLPAIGSHLFWRSGPGLLAPDVQPVHFSVPLYEPWMEGPPNGFSLMAGMIHPVSRGTLRLAGPDPGDGLLLDPRALECEADLEALAAAVRLCREYGAAPALREEWGARELYPGPEVRSEAELRDYVRRTAITYHHQVGTCKMGTDAEAVVDPRLKAHGLQGLRVVDASVMPAVTTGNTHAPTMMIGERGADFLLAEL